MNLYGRKLVSVHMPTRGRMDKCLGAVNEVSRSVADKDRVEIIFKVDRDDSSWRIGPNGDGTYDGECFSSPSDYADPIASKTVILSENKGYSQVHEYYNLCAAISEGDWLFHFSDDAVMKTPNWDQVIADCGIDGSKEIAVLWPENQGHPWCFPIVSRRWYEITGRLSGHISLDGWIKQVADALGVSHPIGIYLGHDKHEITKIPKDETRLARDNFLDGYLGRDGNYITEPPFQSEIQKDIDKLRLAMEAERV